MGRQSLLFEAPPQPAPVDDSRTRDLRVTGFAEEQPISATAAVPVATIAVPATEAAATALGLAVADTATPFLGNTDVFPDADHLTNAGTDLLAEAVAEAVKEAVAGQPKL